MLYEEVDFCVSAHRQEKCCLVYSLFIQNTEYCNSAKDLANVYATHTLQNILLCNVLH